MNTFFKKTIFGLAIIGFGIGGGFDVQAKDKIDAEYPSGTNLNGKKIFNESNIYPGWSKTKIIRVNNDSGNDAGDEGTDVNLYFNFDVKGDKTLAEKLKLYVVRIADNNYRIGGTGDKYTLRSADNKNLYVDRLSATKGKEYKIKIVFDREAGNEYQNLETLFNIDFTVESEEVGGQTEEEILTAQGRTVTGGAGDDESVGNTPSPPPGGGSTLGVSEEGENNGQVAGAETCRSWPLWVWILVLIIFGGASLLNNKKYTLVNFKKHFGLQTGMVILLIVFWYFFDECRNYRWFPIITLVGGILNQLYSQTRREKE